MNAPIGLWHDLELADEGDVELVHYVAARRATGEDD
jgi:hypothetical protein